jgi:hypothetical protein
VDRRVGSSWKGWREGSPRIPDAFSRGRVVHVSARVGRDLTGYVCDSDGVGILLDVRDPSGDATGYEFVPWQSIERLSIEEDDPAAFEDSGEPGADSPDANA